MENLLVDLATVIRPSAVGSTSLARSVRGQGSQNLRAAEITAGEIAKGGDVFSPNASSCIITQVLGMGAAKRRDRFQSLTKDDVRKVVAAMTGEKTPVKAKRPARLANGHKRRPAAPPSAPTVNRLNGQPAPVA